MTDTERERIAAICEVAGVTEINDLSDGFHTFRQLYYQRMILFATIVRQNKDKAWKSLRHEDGELCFGGGWFIVGIDTPEGSYTYHYENKYFDLFDCGELERGKHWDGHTEKDVTRLLSLPKAQLSQEGTTKDTIGRQAARHALCKAVRRRCRMIPEDAIWILELIRNRDARTEAEKDAVNAAIEALKAQLFSEGTTSDLISRQAAIDAIGNTADELYKNIKKGATFPQRQWFDGMAHAQSILEDLPPAHPEPKEGHWINGKCDLCGEHAPFWAMASTYHESNYCPNCGAKMTISTK